MEEVTTCSPGAASSVRMTRARIPPAMKKANDAIDKALATF